MTIGAAREQERSFLLPLAAEWFPIYETLYPLIVDGKGRVEGEGQPVLGAGRDLAGR